MTSSSNLFPLAFLKGVATSLPLHLLEVLERVQLTNGPYEPAERLGAFLDLLFYRSPSELNKGRSEPELRQIALGCLGALYEQRTAPDKTAVLYKSSEHGCGIFTALCDHPFIVSSLAERLYEADITLNCFQHPILSITEDNSKISAIALSYIEVAKSPGVEIQSIVNMLLNTLRSLTVVVKDHRAMLDETASLELSNDSNISSPWGEIPSAEVGAFLGWLADGSFFFIGSARVDKTLKFHRKSGFWNSPIQSFDELSEELQADLVAANSASLSLSITKLRSRSPVHRNVPLLHILIRSPHDNQSSSNAGSWLSLVGYLTSKALACEALDIPILRHKLHQVLASEHTPPSSHDYKYVIEVIDNMPTDEALRLPVRDLQTIAQLALGVFSRDDSRSVTCIDSEGRYALTTVIIPPDRYSATMRSDVQALVESSFKTGRRASEINLDSSKKRQLRLYISTPLASPIKGEDCTLNNSALPDLAQLGRAIQRATLSWDQLLAEQLDLIKVGGEALVKVGFSESYKASTHILEALHDYRVIAGLSEDNRLGVSLFSDTTSSDTAPVLCIASLNGSISLSTAVPVLENLGLDVLDANSYVADNDLGEIHILKCELRSFDGATIGDAAFNARVSPGLVKILQKTAASDPLNLLLRNPGLSIEQIAILRSYCAFLWQTYKIATKRTMWKALAHSPLVAEQFIEYFSNAFDPRLGLDQRQRKQSLAQIEQSYQIALRMVKDITFDRILKALLTLLKNTLRTNFYQGGGTLAFKVHSERVDFMPHPRPLYEISVYSSRIEGTHLRSSKVARGGIRWSERLDDYRSEVLGLVKTQKVKNVIIVPTGAKGGFIVKTEPPAGEAMGAHVQGAYREYISGLLSLADNVVGGKNINPPSCVVYDDFDPYFVVAADKGTATFSDTANAIAQNDYNFWLGDAFASGGSLGYDHKKYGITAKGGWECVKRHARDLAINTDAPFTAVGIGDMSGDVFGNAMIISSNILLLAAFNHKHIFIDPNPNQEAAFKERVRLFNLPRSQWSDFNSDLISRGGGIFERFQKEILVTPEMRAAFALGEDIPETVDGETLISLTLKAPVTLLWNGGIGTYVKARSESHSDVNDGANDTVRINADELRCKIVGEGGNLGFTQRARIAAAQQGVRINTDAIDNSGGVDLSDHEVNLKLLLAPLVANGELSFEGRNELIRELAPDIVDDVLQHNRDQSLLLTTSESRSVRSIERYRSLIREMHAAGFLDRVRDYLPDEPELDLRLSSQKGMYRPELALCSASVKMWLKEGLRGAPLLDEVSLEPYLLRYFPTKIRDRLSKQILSHPLKREIIANEIVSESTLAVGISFLPALVNSTGASIPQAMACLLAADQIFGTKELRNRLRILDTFESCRCFLDAWLDLTTALQRATKWLIQTHPGCSSISELAAMYGGGFSKLIPHARSMFAAAELERYEVRLTEYAERGVSYEDQIALSLLRRVHMVLEILWCSREFEADVKDVAQTISRVFEQLSLSSIFSYEQNLQTNNKWEQELAEGAYQEIRRELAKITGRILKSGGGSSASGFDKLLGSAREFGAITGIMQEVNEAARLKRPFSISVLPLIARHLRELAG
jgi:glutamate dehydrogenase